MKTPISPQSLFTSSNVNPVNWICCTVMSCVVFNQHCRHQCLQCLSSYIWLSAVGDQNIHSAFKLTGSSQKGISIGRRTFHLTSFFFPSNCLHTEYPSVTRLRLHSSKCGCVSVDSSLSVPLSSPPTSPLHFPPFFWIYLCQSVSWPLCNSLFFH